MAGQDKLFDDSVYFDEAIHESMTNERKIQDIMAAIALKPNAINMNNPEYFYVSVINDDVDIYRSGSSDAPNATITYEDESLGEHELYTVSSDTRTLYEGFLWGIPTIKVQETEVPAIHLFGNYTDIYGSDMVIPLANIAELFRHDKTFATLTAELHELDEMNVGTTYQVPLLKNKRTGEVMYRDAKAADVERVIGELGLKPTLVYSVGNAWNSLDHPRPAGGFKLS
ncbi:hypothetical protein EB118_00885 [bacterium]|nr:hypothetical protein [bacterium]NDC93710.1 hypothetical protein [bacterium]NDD82851.1 hypothetical protein [bacterium]NDG28646.1 hypothetical protein [bacterium]